MYPAGTAELRTYAVLSAQFVISICAVEGELTPAMVTTIGYIPAAGQLQPRG